MKNPLKNVDYVRGFHAGYQAACIRMGQYEYGKAEIIGKAGPITVTTANVHKVFSKARKVLTKKHD